MKSINLRKLTTLIMAGLMLAVIAYSTAEACTAFFKYDYVSGMNKICVYSHLGNDYAITIKSYQLCPINIQAPH